MHKVFISYHHELDQSFKDSLVKCGEENKIFIDGSVDTGDIPDGWSDEKIREEIRDHYLRDTTVTILLVGRETKHRKHVDWELYSSMYDGKINKKSGIIVITLPYIGCYYRIAAHDGERENVFSGNCELIGTKKGIDRLHDKFIPDRIADNLEHGAKISVINWNDLDARKLEYMIDKAYDDRESCDYDLSRPMRRNNS